MGNGSMPNPLGFLRPLAEWVGQRLGVKFGPDDPAPIVWHWLPARAFSVAALPDQSIAFIMRENEIQFVILFADKRPPIRGYAHTMDDAKQIVIEAWRLATQPGRR